jgi:hypothetical protein
MKKVLPVIGRWVGFLLFLGLVVLIFAAALGAADNQNRIESLEATIEAMQ